MLVKYHIFFSDDPESKGGGISVVVETTDFHVESVELLNSFKRMVENLPILDDKDGKKIEHLYIQSVDYSDREHPMGMLGQPHKLQW